MRPYFKHDEVFPIIENVLKDYSQHSTDYMEEGDIVTALIEDQQGRVILGQLPKHHPVSWWAHNMVAFFSKTITEDKTVPPRFMKFKRRKMAGKWAYRVRSAEESSTSASSPI
jgi:hypothetical protein